MSMMVRCRPLCFLLLPQMLANCIPTQGLVTSAPRRDATFGPETECHSRLSLSSNEMDWFEACMKIFAEDASNGCLKCERIVINARNIMVRYEDNSEETESSSFSPWTDPIFMALSSGIIMLVFCSILFLLAILCRRKICKNTDKECTLCLNEKGNKAKTVEKCPRVPVKWGKLSGRSCKVSPHCCQNYLVGQSDQAIKPKNEKPKTEVV